MKKYPDLELVSEKSWFITFSDEESVTLKKSSFKKLFVWRFLGPVQEASTAAEELFRPSEFCTCLTDLLFLTTAPFPIFPIYRADRHTSLMKLCLLAGSPTTMTGTWSPFSRVSLNHGRAQAVDTCGRLSKPYKLWVWNANLIQFLNFFLTKPTILTWTMIG